MCGKRGCRVWLFWRGNDLWKWPSLSQISKVCVPEMLLNNTKVESGFCNCVCVCACCSVGPLQSYCCFSYHPGQKQIACQNKRSHFLAMGRQLSERMHLGCIFYFIHSGMPANQDFCFGGSQGSEKACEGIMGGLVFQAVLCSSFSASDTRRNSLKWMWQHSLWRTVQSFYHFFLIFHECHLK